jgi:hypothetical protein
MSDASSDLAVIYPMDGGEDVCSGTLEQPHAHVARNDRLVTRPNEAPKPLDLVVDLLLVLDDVRLPRQHRH